MAKTDETWYYFRMRHSWSTAFNDLDDEEAGRLIKAIFAFEKNGIVEKPRGNERFAYSIIVSELIRDSQEENELSVKRRKAAMARWENADAHNEPVSTAPTENAMQSNANDANAQDALQNEQAGANATIKKESNVTNPNEIIIYSDETDSPEINQMEELFRMEEEQARKEAEKKQEKAPQWKPLNTVDDVNAIKPKKQRTAFKKPTVEEIAFYCKEHGYIVDPNQFYDHYESNGWMVGKTKMVDWKASVRTWERKRKENGGAGNGWSGHNGDHGENTEEVRNKYKGLHQISVSNMQ